MILYACHLNKYKYLNYLLQSHTSGKIFKSSSSKFRSDFFMFFNNEENFRNADNKDELMRSLGKAPYAN